MKVTTWNNGSFNQCGLGYGIRIPKDSRDKFFNKEWDSIILHIEDEEVEIKLHDRFWTTCNELRSKEIGKYLIKYGLGKWGKGEPHELDLSIYTYREFRLERY